MTPTEILDGFAEIYNLEPSDICTALIAGAAMIITLIIEIRFILTHNINHPIEKKIAKAEALGHVIPAKRISLSHSTRDFLKNSRFYAATYEYELNGKTRHYRYVSANHAAVTMNLYYIKNPRFLFTRGEKTQHGQAWLYGICAIICIGVFLLVYLLCGGKIG